MIAQPQQFSVAYAGIFQDASVVAAYGHRSPYPAETFARLAELIDKSVSPVRILDAGCGTGQMTRGLLAYADQIDAVDLSAAMIEAGKRMDYGTDPRINWVVGGIEAVTLRPPYALIVAAASLHWMPWDTTLPRFACALSTNGYLAIVETRSAHEPWGDEIGPLFAQYSMNQEFQPYNMQTVAEALERQGYFRQIDCIEAQPVTTRQPIGDWIEAIHASNGFSRDRMDPKDAAAFDRQVRELLLTYCPDDEVQQQISARIIIGKPLAPKQR